MVTQQAQSQVNNVSFCHNSAAFAPLVRCTQPRERKINGKTGTTILVVRKSSRVVVIKYRTDKPCLEWHGALPIWQLPFVSFCFISFPSFNEPFVGAIGIIVVATSFAIFVLHGVDAYHWILPVALYYSRVASCWGDRELKKWAEFLVVGFRTTIRAPPCMVMLVGVWSLWGEERAQW